MVPDYPDSRSSTTAVIIYSTPEQSTNWLFQSCELLEEPWSMYDEAARDMNSRNKMRRSWGKTSARHRYQQRKWSHNRPR